MAYETGNADMQRAAAGCPECLDGYVQAACGSCGGKGCATCGGEGFLVAECDACGGSGYAPALATHSVVPGLAAAGSVIAEAAALAAGAAAMRANFELAQAEADRAKADRARRERERDESEEARRKPRRDAIQSASSSLAVPLAAAANLYYLYQSRARLFTGDAREFDPISRSLLMGLCAKTVTGPGAGCIGNLVAVAFIVLLWLLHVAIEVLLFVPIAFAIRWAVGFAANRAYPSATGARLSSIDSDNSAKDVLLGTVAVVAVTVGLLWFNYSVFPEGSSSAAQQPQVDAETVDVRYPAKAYVQTNVAGRWHGMFSGQAAQLTITGRQGNRFEGELATDGCTISVSGTLPEGGGFDFHETSVLSARGSTWTLGDDTGSFQRGGSRIEGRGVDRVGHGYTWAFAR